MAFHLINPINGAPVISVGRGDYYELKTTKPFYILPLTIGVLTHQVKIQIDPGTVVIITRNPGVLETYGLWVDCGQVVSGSINTPVFNMGASRARIAAGESISRLVAL